MCVTLLQHYIYFSFFSFSLLPSHASIFNLHLSTSLILLSYFSSLSSISLHCITSLPLFAFFLLAFHPLLSFSLIGQNLCQRRVFALMCTSFFHHYTSSAFLCLSFSCAKSSPLSPLLSLLYPTCTCERESSTLILHLFSSTLLLLLLLLLSTLPLSLMLNFLSSCFSLHLPLPLFSLCHRCPPTSLTYTLLHLCCCISCHLFLLLH